MNADLNTKERRRWLAEMQDNMRRRRAWLLAKGGSGRMLTCRRGERRAKLLPVALVLLAGLTPPPAEADKYLTLNMRSWHHVEGEFQKWNWGAGVERGHYRAGAYRNSYDDAAVYAGVGWEQRVADWATVGVDALAIYGYKEAPLMPLIAPNVSLGGEKVNVKLYTVGAVSAMQVRVEI